jgi:hypothetical protein
MKNISEKTLLIIFIALVAVFGISLNSKVESRINNLSNQVGSLSANVSSQNQQINGLYSQIEDLLKKQGSIIDSYDITYGTFNSDDMTYEVSLIVTPKESKESTTAAFNLGDLRSDMSRSGTSFSATIKVPVAKEVSPTVTFYEDGNIRSETLNDTVSFRENFIYQIKCGFSGGTTYRDRQLRYDGNIFISFAPPNGSVTESGRLLAILNDKEIWTKEIPVDAQNENNIKFNETFPVNSGDKFTLFAEIRDKSGITYRYPMDRTAVSPDGKSRSEDYLPGQCTIYDKNGKEIRFD